MDKKFVVAHVNRDHEDALIAIYKKHINNSFKKLIFKDFDLEYMTISVDEKKDVKIPFPKKMKTLNDFRDTFIEMFKNAKEGFDLKKVKQNLNDFLSTVHSVSLATMLKNEPVLSCATLMVYAKKYYIYISEIAEHYWAIKENPTKIKIMWIQDESLANSPINRVRAIFKAEAHFIDSKTILTKVFNAFEKSVGTAGGVQMLRTMKDFHLIELKLKGGRFVQGFGQAYNITPEMEIISLNHHQVHKH